MSKDTNKAQNWFDRGGEAYARFRPEYPPELADFLATLTRNNHHVLDVGCGTGQLTQLLANTFDWVTGVDPSAEQLQNTQPHDRIVYQAAPAEKLPNELNNIDLITVAQAAHWFHLPAFYAEVKRIAAPDGVIALISYGVLCPDDSIRERFQQFYYDEIGPYWPSERRLVDEGYKGIDFPFEELTAPPMEIRVEWTLEALAGYISTWSAVRRAVEANREELLLNFYKDISALWGDPSQKRVFTWPINMRIGKVQP